MPTSETAVALSTFHTWWRRIADRGEFSSSALSALDSLDRLGPQRISDLAARERLSQPGMTGLVTRLSDDGLVERVPDPADGRATRATLTDAGRARIAVLRERRRDQLAGLVEALSPADQRALAAAAPALSRLVAVPLDLSGQDPAGQSPAGQHPTDPTSADASTTPAQASTLVPGGVA